MQLPDTLPRVEVHHDPLTCTCGQCGGLLETVGEEISEKLDYIPGRFQVIRHIRPKLACRPCGTIESPALPAQVIDKGLPTARLVAHVMTAKHVDHLPLYRQETQYLRAGVPISRATLCSWLGQGEYWISMLAEACKMALLEGTILHADETPLPVLHPGSGKTDKAYLWVYRSQADAPHPIVAFDYAPDRKGIHAQNFLGDWKGILQTDDYGGMMPSTERSRSLKPGAGRMCVATSMTWNSEARVRWRRRRWPGSPNSMALRRTSKPPRPIKKPKPASNGPAPCWNPSAPGSAKPRCRWRLKVASPKPSLMP